MFNQFDRLHMTQQNKQENRSIDTQKFNVTKNRAAGLMLLIVLFSILWVYGWASQIKLIESVSFSNKYPVTRATQSLYCNLFIISSIFTVIGFGMLFAFFKKATFNAFFTSIFIVSFTFLISPIFQKFWFNVFLSNFNGELNSINNNPDQFLQMSFGGKLIEVDFYNLKFALSNSISQLILAVGLIGKLSCLQFIIGSFLFNFCWNLNHFLCIMIQIVSSDNRIFDDYQISCVYLFAATFGLVICKLSKNAELTNHFSSNSSSVVLSQLGTFFIFLSFCTTTTFYSMKFSKTLTTTNPQLFPRVYIWQQAFISTFFALSASVISTYAWSIILNNKSKIGIRESLIGTFMGAILYGPIAGTCQNIGAAIAVGLGAGFISSIFYQKIYTKINQNGVRDSLGLMGIFMISLLGVILVSPIVLKVYSMSGKTLNSLAGTSISSNMIPLWVLIYVGISMGIGLISGLIVGIIFKSISDKKFVYFSDQMMHINLYSLRQKQSRIYNDPQRSVSALN